MIKEKKKKNKNRNFENFKHNIEYNNRIEYFVIIRHKVWNSNYKNPPTPLQNLHPLQHIHIHCRIFITMSILPETTHEKTLSDAWDYTGKPAIKAKTGGWVAAAMILGPLSLIFPFYNAKLKPFELISSSKNLQGQKGLRGLQRWELQSIWSLIWLKQCI